MEIQDLQLIPRCDDGSMPQDYSFSQFVQYLSQGFGIFGIDLTGLDKIPKFIEQAGFTNVQERVFKVPIGPWPRDPHLKTIGAYNRAVVWGALHAAAMRTFTRGLKWTPEEVELFIVQVRKSLMDPMIHSYMTYHVVFAQKPMN